MCDTEKEIALAGRFRAQIDNLTTTLKELSALGVDIKVIFRQGNREVEIIHSELDLSQSFSLKTKLSKKIEITL